METETKTRPVVHAPGAVHGSTEDRVPVSMQGGVLWLDRDDLQAIVQQAYDTRGILAEPSLSVELARAEDGLREFADRWGQSLRGQQ